MSRLDETDIQGFVLRGYGLPCARFLFLRFTGALRARALVGGLLKEITTGETWDYGKPESTVNLAFTHPGLVALALPDPTLLSFPVEFVQGMKARAAIVGDSGRNAPERWDACGAKRECMRGSPCRRNRKPRWTRAWRSCRRR